MVDEVCPLLGLTSFVSKIRQEFMSIMVSVEPSRLNSLSVGAGGEGGRRGGGGVKSF